VIVAPCGELDCATVEHLRAAVDDLVAGGWDSIVFDLRRLSFMDSTGLCSVVRQTLRTDVTVRLVDGALPVARLFDLTGLRCDLPFTEPDPRR
jgi:anti-sigma B factor antagonist